MYLHRLDPEMHGILTDFCHHIKKPRDLPVALNKCFQQPDPFVELREKYIADMLYKLDGRASERIRNSILSRVN